MLKDMGLSERKLPRDVSTCWNSTYNMLSFAVDHKAAVNAMTGNAGNGLRAYEMDGEEWSYAEELCSVLKVREQV
jgi:hypothetical protein